MGYIKVFHVILKTARYGERKRAKIRINRGTQLIG